MSKLIVLHVCVFMLLYMFVLHVYALGCCMSVLHVCALCCYICLFCMFVFYAAECVFIVGAFVLLYSTVLCTFL